MSNSVQPYRQEPTRLPHLWDSPGKNTGVGCHFLLQCMKVTSESEVAQSCPTLRDPMDLPTRLLHPWDFPGKSTRIGCHRLLRNGFWNSTVIFILILQFVKVQKMKITYAFKLKHSIKRELNMFINMTIWGKSSKITGFKIKAHTKFRINFLSSAWMWYFFNKGCNNVLC